VSDAEIFRALRYGSADVTVSAQGPAAGVVIQDAGMRWLELRRGPLAVYGGYLRLCFRMTRINDMKQKVGFRDLFKCRFKGFNELVWQFLDESDGIAQQDLLLLWQVHYPRRRI